MIDLLLTVNLHLKDIHDNSDQDNGQVSQQQSRSASELRGVGGTSGASVRIGIGIWIGVRAGARIGTSAGLGRGCLTSREDIDSALMLTVRVLTTNEYGCVKGGERRDFRASIDVNIERGESAVERVEQKHRVHIDRDAAEGSSCAVITAHHEDRVVDSCDGIVDQRAAQFNSVPNVVYQVVEVHLGGLNVGHVEDVVEESSYCGKSLDVQNKLHGIDC